MIFEGDAAFDCRVPRTVDQRRALAWAVESWSLRHNVSFERLADFLEQVITALHFQEIVEAPPGSTVVDSDIDASARVELLGIIHRHRQAAVAAEETD